MRGNSNKNPSDNAISDGWDNLLAVLLSFFAVVYAQQIESHDKNLSQGKIETRS